MTNYAETLRRLAPGSNAACPMIGGGFAFYSSFKIPPSRVMCLGLNGPVSADDLDRIEAFYRARHEPVRIQLFPFSDKSLLDLLRERGYAVSNFNDTHARILSAQDKFPPPAEGVTVRLAAPDEDKLWAETLARGFATDESIAFPIEATLAMFHEPGAQAYIAFCKDQPSGAAALDMADGCASFFAAAVVPECRNRGAHTALLSARLTTAAENGCDLAVMMALPGGGSQRNALRLGFELVYTRVEMEKKFD